MTATAIGYSPWSLYGPCGCGAPAGEPCLTGSTGAARLVVHHSRRPVDDVTNAGFTPVLTAEERQLLAAVHRWARRKAGYWPVWERGLLPGMWHTHPRGAQWIDVAFGPANDEELTVEIKSSRYGEQLLDETVRPRTVREAVDLLVAWGILPVTFSSAYAAGQRSALLGSLLSAPQPVLPRGWNPDHNRPLPRLLGFTPITDPAIRQDGA